MTITGKVTDARTGEPIIGANVYESTAFGIVSGPGTTTNVNGEFTLITTLTENEAGFASVSYLGYNRLTQTIIGGDGDVVWDVKLKAGIGISEVVVKDKRSHKWVYYLLGFGVATGAIYYKFKS